MAKLRINDIPASAGRSRRVEVTWEDERAAPRVAVAEFGDAPDAGDGERIRWYLEDYAEFPADPAPALAAAAETRLADTGAELFRRVFSDADAAGIWERARGRLADARVEVDTDPGAGPGLAWELLRDPARDAPVALGAGAFVRTHHRAAGQPDLPEPSGDRLRVLLVICRPGGRADVPFRSVASRLVRGGAEQMAGLDLDVLRPATFARLAEVLHAAQGAGRPYHVVHFDGHGTYLDLEGLGFSPGGTGGGGGGEAGLALPRDKYGVSVAGPVRGGQHGYLLFEDPDSTENQQLVDGPTLGRLLTDTGVPVLVLNACRSAYTEARDQPGGTSAEAPGPEAGRAGARPSAEGGDGVLTGDVHARIRAYGSLAAEVADSGVPGVVAMRYNVYVVTAAQFVADLYGHLLAGKSLGQAVAAARKALAADPVRQIGPVPVSLQDWTVPLVYESAPLVLLRSPDHEAPLVKLTTAETKTGDGEAGGVPRPPDAGFFGRDETLLALDRAFDTQPIVLLHAFAGSGKTSTAAEFARWYQATGGLDLPDHPEWPGAVLWSSFEHHLTADRVVGTAGDFFAGLLEANGIQWAAVTDPAQRRDIVWQVLAQVPVLWVWDNVEPVTGFPEGTPSDWVPAEQDDLAGLLRDLAQTRCKLLVTSRRDEHTWLGDLPARVRLPPMPMRESVQLAAALAARHGHSLGIADWRPLLRYSAGNPLTITVLIGQALRGGLTATDAIQGFVAALEAGEAQLEAGEDAALGRTRSLAASLSYGFAEAFTDAEQAQLAVLHLFRDTVYVDALRFMGAPELAGDDAVPQLSGLSRNAGIDLLDRAADVGLLTSLGGGYFAIHPALPWYFTSLFTRTYGPADAARAVRAYSRTLGSLADYYWQANIDGRTEPAVAAIGLNPVAALRLEEANMQHALALSRADQRWYDAVRCVQGLRALYENTGRAGEWARLVEEITPDYVDLATGEPLPGREDHWDVVTGYRIGLARDALDWPTAARLLQAVIARRRPQAAAALAAPEPSPAQRAQLRNLAVSVAEIGGILKQQGDNDCLPSYLEALDLFHRSGARAEEANVAANLGNAYRDVPGLRDLGKARSWHQYALDLRAKHDRRGERLEPLAAIALQQFFDARKAGAADTILLEHLNTALRGYLHDLDLLHADELESRAICYNQLGIIYLNAGLIREAMECYQQSLRCHEARSNVHGAALARFNIALVLAADRRPRDALQYARAALDAYHRLGPGVAADIDKAEWLIARLEQQSGD